MVIVGLSRILLAFYAGILIFFVVVLCRKKINGQQDKKVEKELTIFLVIE